MLRRGRKEGRKESGREIGRVGEVGGLRKEVEGWRERREEGGKGGREGVIFHLPST